MPEWRVSVDCRDDNWYFQFTNNRQGWTIRTMAISEACAHSVARDLRMCMEMEILPLDMHMDQFSHYISVVIAAWWERHRNDDLIGIEAVIGD